MLRRLERFRSKSPAERISFDHAGGQHAYATRDMTPAQSLAVQIDMRKLSRAQEVVHVAMVGRTTQNDNPSG